MLCGKHGLRVREMRRKVTADVTNEVRYSRWTLVQNDDGTLHVEQEATYPDGDHKKRVVAINHFMQEAGPPARSLQKLIDRMFDDT
jgi:hypothetical protein